MLIGIDFFDEDVINTLIPIFTLHPQKEILFYSKRDKEYLESVKAAVIAHGIKDIAAIEVDEDNFSDIENKLRAVLNSASNEEVYIELTGGTELMIACGYKLGIEYNTRLYHIDFDKMIVTNVRTDEIVCNACNLTLNDYIVAIGGKRVGDSHFVPQEEEYSTILYLAEYIFDNNQLWKETCKVLMNVASRMPVISKDVFTKEMNEFLSKFVEFGYLLDSGNNYVFRDERAKQYMITIGIWLELYIYIKLKQAYGSADIGVGIDWDFRDKIPLRNNEIDDVIMYNSSPVFFSCKMQLPQSISVAEVGYLAKRLGGIRAQAVMVTTAKRCRKNRRIFNHMRDMHVGYIEIPKLRQAADVKQFFDNVLKSVGFEIA